MKTEQTGVATNLSGDWTMNSISHQIESLLAISTDVGDLVPRNKTLVVDCSGISKIDMSGLQLLYVWQQCLQIRGLQAELVNLSDGMRSTVQQVGLHTIFKSSHDSAVS